MMQVRKYGICIIFISQRTAVVAKSALAQCENIIAFKSVDQTGLDYLESFLGSEFKNLLPSLNHGEAVVFGPAISSNTGVAIDTFNK
jgi:DNA helicase HerA-like ATPase